MACIHDTVARLAAGVWETHTAIALQAGMAYDTYYKWRSHGAGCTIRTLERLVRVARAVLYIIPEEQRVPEYLQRYRVDECLYE